MLKALQLRLSLISTTLGMLTYQTGTFGGALVAQKLYRTRELGSMLLAGYARLE